MGLNMWSINECKCEGGGGPMYAVVIQDKNTGELLFPTHSWEEIKAAVLAKEPIMLQLTFVENNEVTVHYASQINQVSASSSSLIVGTKFKNYGLYPDSLYEIE